jgi:metal-responsive CopG/Arc/MetJ family transcriptional regulator
VKREQAFERISATISENVYTKFEQAREHDGLNRSEAIEAAMKLFVKAQYAKQVYMRRDRDAESDVAYAESSLLLFAEMIGEPDEPKVKRAFAKQTAKR